MGTGGSATEARAGVRARRRRRPEGSGRGENSTGPAEKYRGSFPVLPVPSSCRRLAASVRRRLRTVRQESHRPPPHPHRRPDPGGRPSDRQRFPSECLSSCPVGKRGLLWRQSSPPAVGTFTGKGRLTARPPGRWLALDAFLGPGLLEDLAGAPGESGSGASIDGFGRTAPRWGSSPSTRYRRPWGLRAGHLHAGCVIALLEAGRHLAPRGVVGVSRCR